MLFQYQGSVIIYKDNHLADNCCSFGSYNYNSNNNYCTTTPATTLFMAASSTTTNDSSRLNTSVPEDYSSTKDDSADAAKLLGNYGFILLVKLSFIVLFWVLKIFRKVATNLTRAQGKYNFYI